MPPGRRRWSAGRKNDRAPTSGTIYNLNEKYYCFDSDYCSGLGTCPTILLPLPPTPIRRRPFFAPQIACPWYWPGPQCLCCTGSRSVPFGSTGQRTISGKPHPFLCAFIWLPPRHPLPSRASKGIALQRRRSRHPRRHHATPPRQRHPPGHLPHCQAPWRKRALPAPRPPPDPPTRLRQQRNPPRRRQGMSRLCPP